MSLKPASSLEEEEGTDGDDEDKENYDEKGVGALF